MKKRELKFEDYLSDILPDFIPLVTAVRDKLAAAGCSVSLTEAKSGRVVSFKGKNKKVVANLVARKGGPQIRLYADNYASYMDSINSLPEGMKQAIMKSSDCKRLFDPEKCNSRCPMGYAVELDGDTYKKCRYGAFMFPVNGENISGILSLLDSEAGARGA